MLVSSRKTSFTSINSLRDIGLPEATLEKLADADAFRSIGLDRREALWKVSTKDRPIALFAGQQSEDAKYESVSLPIMSESEHVVQDYASISLSLRAHPVSFVREKLQQLHVLSTKELATAKNDDPVKVAGLVLVRQRPGTAKGVCFMTIEDETGCANIVIFPNLFEEFRKDILQSSLIMIEGKLQIEGEVVHVILSRCYNISKLLRPLTATLNEDLPLLTLARPDQRPEIQFHIENKNAQQEQMKQQKIFPDARNFK